MIGAGDDRQDGFTRSDAGGDNRFEDLSRREVQELGRFERAQFFGGRLEGRLFDFFCIEKTGDVIDHDSIIQNFRRRPIIKAMGNSQLATARLSNLLALAVIVLVFLLLLSVLAEAFVPRAWLKSPYLAEFCIGQRMVVSEGRYLPWLQGIWLSAPPRVTNSSLEYNTTGTLCGLVPWVSGVKGFWYREVRR